MAIGAVAGNYSQLSGISTQQAGKLDQDAFLQLFVTQLKCQDPSSPMDTSSMLNQIAQLSIVEQLAKISADITQIKLSQELGEASALLGKQVTVQTSDGNKLSGPVEKTTIYGSEVKIFINGTGYGLDQITEFQMG